MGQQLRSDLSELAIPDDKKSKRLALRSLSPIFQRKLMSNENSINFISISIKKYLITCPVAPMTCLAGVFVQLLSPAFDSAIPATGVVFEGHVTTDNAQIEGPWPVSFVLL